VDFIGFAVTALGMPDWSCIAPVIKRQGWIYVHDASSGLARNSPARVFSSLHMGVKEVIENNGR
jgi:hypothetical protein